MSFATWSKIYYPIPANKCLKEDAEKHSLRKWKGLKPSILKRHGLRIIGGLVV